MRRKGWWQNPEKGFTEKELSKRGGQIPARPWCQRRKDRIPSRYANGRSRLMPQKDRVKGEPNTVHGCDLGCLGEVKPRTWWAQVLAS